MVSPLPQTATPTRTPVRDVEETQSEEGCGLSPPSAFAWPREQQRGGGGEGPGGQTPAPPFLAVCAWGSLWASLGAPCEQGCWSP